MSLHKNYGHYHPSSVEIVPVIRIIVIENIKIRYVQFLSSNTGKHSKIFFSLLLRLLAMDLFSLYLPKFLIRAELTQPCRERERERERGMHGNHKLITSDWNGHQASNVCYFQMYLQLRVKEIKSIQAFEIVMLVTNVTTVVISNLPVSTLKLIILLA